MSVTDNMKHAQASPLHVEALSVATVPTESNKINKDRNYGYHH
jgi:hypothetical protein